MPLEDRQARALVDALPALVFIADGQGAIRFTNARLQAYVGRPSARLLGEGWLEIVHPEDRAQSQALWRRAVDAGQAYQAEHRIRRHDGKYRWHLCRAEPLRGEAGTAREWLASCTDIDDPKRAEPPMRHGEARARTALSELDGLINNAPCGIALFDTDLRHIRLNDAAVLADGVPAHAHIGKRVSELMPELGRTVEPLLRQVRDTGQPVVGIEITAHMAAEPERRRHWLASYYPVRDGAERLVAVGALAVEITAYKRAQRELRDQNERLRTLLDTLPVGVFIAHDVACRRITGNPAAAKLLRVPPESNMSKSASDLEQPLPFRILKDGREVPNEALPVQRAARGEVVEDEALTDVFEDGTVVETIVSARPLYGPAGDVTGAIATVLDVTELKHAEKALIEADRRKDEFLALLAHELRNPLAPIQTGLDLMQLAGATDEMVARAREVMQRQVTHLVHLVDDLLDVARITRGRIELKRKQLDLRHIMEEAVELAAPLVSERRHELIVSSVDRPVRVRGDSERLTQAVCNLLTNAARYTHVGGTIWISTEVHVDVALLRVKDTGVGLAADELDRIFEIFVRSSQRSAGDGGGLGVGLSLAREILLLHGGSIEARSEGMGHGSEFIVRMPLHTSDIGAPATDPDRSVVPSVGRRVLVVDDNADVAETLATLLRLAGHAVKTAADGRKALRSLAAFCPDIVLLDIGLPGMDGYEVARRIRRLPAGQPPLKLVAVTGWGQQSDRRRALAAGFDALLAKPVPAAALHRILADTTTHPAARSENAQPAKRPRTGSPRGMAAKDGPSRR